MNESVRQDLQAFFAEQERQGLLSERCLCSQSRSIEVQGRKVLNFCANNYLGFDNKDVIQPPRMPWTGGATDSPR